MPNTRTVSATAYILHHNVTPNVTWIARSRAAREAFSIGAHDTEVHAVPHILCTPKFEWGRSRFVCHIKDSVHYRSDLRLVDQDGDGHRDGHWPARRTRNRTLRSGSTAAASCTSWVCPAQAGSYATAPRGKCPALARTTRWCDQSPTYASHQLRVVCKLVACQENRQRRVDDKAP